MNKPLTIVWLRQDLRTADNPALAHAACRGAVLPVFILDPDDPWPLGGAGRWWLHHALEDLGRSLTQLGAPLVLRRGKPLEVLLALAQETGADNIVWNRLYEPYAAARDAEVERKLRAKGIATESFNASLLFEPWEIQTKSGTPFKVFTPFSKACLAAPAPLAPLPSPGRLAPAPRARSEKLKDWGLLPEAPDWSSGLKAFWKVGEGAALDLLHSFIDEAMAAYKQDRDRPDHEGTSRLSPYLHYGQIGPRQIWHAVGHAMQADPSLAQGGKTFLRQLLWREFSYHLLHHFPALPDSPLQKAYARFPWRKDESGLKAWQKGQTGYPIVDAGMRQLWQTGWMHNRVRMIVGSFLVKDLLLPWQAGESWFWDTLVDADLANNAASWQWVGGCGTDAAPFFRVFNPVLQGRKFDPTGDYVRRYVPELKGIKGQDVHAPWLLPAEKLKESGVVFGKNYPLPIVDHAAARQKALLALRKIKKT